MMANPTPRNCLWTLAFLVAGLVTGWSQEVSGQAGAHPEEQSSTQVVSPDAPPSQDNTAPQAEKEATYSTLGMGMPSAEPPLRNYLLLGLTANESVQYGPANTSSGPYQTDSVTRVFGSLDYLRTKGRSQTAIDYRGGGFFFVNSDSSNSTNQVQQLTAQQSFSWQRTKLLLVDSVSNFPGGNFGAGWFGGTSAYNLGLPAGTAIPAGANVADFFGFNAFGGLGQGNFLTNVTLAQVTQEVTPRSALTFVGGYAFTDQIGNQDFITSKQASAAVSYNYQLTPRSAIGGFYGYQDIRFVGGDQVMTNTVQATFQHNISSTTGYALGGGPEFTRFSGPLNFTIGGTVIPFTTTNDQVGASAYASVYHNFSNSNISFWYDHLVTGGSGLFAGASSDVAQFSFSRPISRVWAVSFDAGFVRLSSIGSASNGLLGNSYSYGFVGAGVQRRLGRRFSFYASYQFNDENYNSSSCGVTFNCTGFVQRHVAVAGISWRSHPVVLGSGDNQNSGVQPLGNPPMVPGGNPPSLP
jgi:hypothetical protein